MMRDLEEVDLFVSKTADEVMRMYKQQLALSRSARMRRDTTASAAAVGYFYYGVYHTPGLAPAMSNRPARCVLGISDTLTTNVFAEAGRCGVRAIVFARDTAPELKPEAPNEMVKVFTRRLDLENTVPPQDFECTAAVEALPALAASLARCRRELARHG